MLTEGDHIISPSIKGTTSLSFNTGDQRAVLWNHLDSPDPWGCTIIEGRRINSLGTQVNIHFYHPK